MEPFIVYGDNGEIQGIDIVPLGRVEAEELIKLHGNLPKEQSDIVRVFARVDLRGHLQIRFR